MCFIGLTPVYKFNQNRMFAPGFSRRKAFPEMPKDFSVTVKLS